MTGARRAAWTLDRAGGRVHCALLSDLPGVAHLFSTRRAAPTGRRLFTAAGFGRGRPWPLKQVHGASVVVLERGTAPGVEADASIADRESRAGRWPAVYTADCLPILIADRDGKRIAAVHAGWRGTAAGIVGFVVQHLRRCGAPPESLVAAIGPGIRACCYEVGAEVAQAVARAGGEEDSAVRARSASGRPSVDLLRANREQLRRAGLAPEAIAAAPWCTACEPSLFFSYRRDGKLAGRQLAVIGWASGRGPGSP